MKNLTLLTLSFFAAIAGFTETKVQTNSSFKPSKGQRSAEVNLNFQTGTAPLSYNLPAELRFRYFIQDQIAIRLRVGLMMNSSKYSVSNPQGTVVAEVKNNSGFSFSFSPGIEKHFAGTKRLSPFVGAQLSLAYNNGTRKTVRNSGYANPSNNLVINGDYYDFNEGTTYSLGLGTYLGADYYVAEHIYLGAEFGLGLFSMSKTAESQEKYVRLGAAELNTKTLRNSNSKLFGVYTGGIRLGFVF